MSRSLYQLLLISKVYDAQHSPCDHGCRFWNQCPQCRARLNELLDYAKDAGVEYRKMGIAQSEHWKTAKDAL